MQVHLRRELLAVWRTLPPEVRRFVESLERNPRPSTAMTMPERPNYYEQPIAGVWIGWTVDDVGSETIIVVAIVEPLL